MKIKPARWNVAPRASLKNPARPAQPAGHTVHKNSNQGFTLLDLLVVGGAVMFLGFWLGLYGSRERKQIAGCSANLKVLGQAMRSYADDHDDGLPAAGINLEIIKTSWDGELIPYLKPGSGKSKDGVSPVVSRRFFCPSEPFTNYASRRSYAMSAHKMSLAFWPPSTGDRTGAGLLWSKTEVATLLSGPGQNSNADDLPRLKSSIVSDPANTLLLTELITPENILGKWGLSRVEGINDQVAPFGVDSARFHFGKFNYLMADGHVELLTPLQTGGIGARPAGIWTIKAGD